MACVYNGLLVLKKDGSIVCVGRQTGSTYEFGNGVAAVTNYDCSTPATPGLTNVKAIYSGPAHVVAVKSDGTVWQWGKTNVTYSVPTQIPLSGVVHAAAGGYGLSLTNGFSLAVLADGTVWGWGDNASGQLGNGGTSPTTTPVKANISDVVQVAAGANHTLFLKRDGTVWACGAATNGALGNGTTTPNQSTPVQVLEPVPGAGFLTGIKKIFAGGNATGQNASFAIDGEGKVYAWGYSYATYNWLGINNLAAQNRPRKVLGLRGINSISVTKNASNVPYNVWSTFVGRGPTGIWTSGYGSSTTSYGLGKATGNSNSPWHF